MFHDPFAMFGNQHVRLHSADTPFFCADPGTIVAAVRQDPHQEGFLGCSSGPVTVISANGWTSYPWSMVANQQLKLPTGMAVQVVLLKQIYTANFSELQ